jgi:hypothetical protein
LTAAAHAHGFSREGFHVWHSPEAGTHPKLASSRGRVLTDLPRVAAVCGSSTFACACDDLAKQSCWFAPLLWQCNGVSRMARSTVCLSPDRPTCRVCHLRNVSNRSTTGSVSSVGSSYRSYGQHGATSQLFYGRGTSWKRHASPPPAGPSHVLHGRCTARRHACGHRRCGGGVGGRRTARAWRRRCGTLLECLMYFIRRVFTLPVERLVCRYGPLYLRNERLRIWLSANSLSETPQREPSSWTTSTRSIIVITCACLVSRDASLSARAREGEREREGVGMSVRGRWVSGEG